MSHNISFIEHNLTQKNETKEEQPKQQNYLPCQKCKEISKFQCPKCLSLNIPKPFAAFCSQDCFRESWADHRKIHSSGGKWLYCLNRGRGRHATMPHFEWTGNLRPDRIGPMRYVPDHIDKPDYALSGIPHSEIQSNQQRQIPVWNGKDLEKIRDVCKLARFVLDQAHANIAPGVTTDKIDEIVHNTAIEHNAYPSPLNYFSFPKSVCTSINEVICHGIPDARSMNNGDICNVDVTVYRGGFHGDLNETYVVGEVDEAYKRLIKVTYECLELAISHVKPGVRYREIGEIISKHAGENGYSVVKTYCGHGIGNLFHCAPSVPHYTRNKAIGVMKVGHVFTIEPMINEGIDKDLTWPDEWTAVTIDGKRSAQFEHTLLVTESGCEILTARTESSPPLWWQK